jgi:hypothetical protein
MTYIGILAYLQPAKGKKPRKAAAGQKEMLLPISDKRTAKEDKKEGREAHACSRSEAGMMDMQKSNGACYLESAFLMI